LSLVVGDGRNDGFRTGLCATPAVTPEIAESGPIARTRSP
jgi:dihydroxyacid dehydratase/phosphogluconate dehydratase